MRDPELRILALQCLQIADHGDLHHSEVVKAATAYYAFVTGDGEASAKAKLDAVREAIA